MYKVWVVVLIGFFLLFQTQGANCLTVGEDFIFIGCSDGIVRCFSPHTLQFITTLPRTHYLGVDVSKGLTISHMVSHPSGVRYPDASAITYDEQNFKVTVIYNDHRWVVVWEFCPQEDASCEVPDPKWNDQGDDALVSHLKNR